MMTLLYVFRTKESPLFLDTSPLDFREQGADFLEKLRKTSPSIDYPYLALVYDFHSKTEDLCFFRPDSWNIGGQQGGLSYRSDDFDASKPEGLSRMIHEELSKPKNERAQHLNPISCVVDFIGTHPVLDAAYKLLKDKYQHDVQMISL